MSQEKNRHGCLTAWLIFMLIAGTFSVLMYVFSGDMISQALPSMPSWAVPSLIIISLINLAFTIALFLWKKWAFWGFCAVAIVTFGINLAVGLGIGQALLGLIGVVLLYGVLQIGDGNKGWPQLE